MTMGKFWLWSILGAGVVLLCLHATENVLAGRVLADKVWTLITLSVVLALGGLFPKEIRRKCGWAVLTVAALWLAFTQTIFNESGKFMWLFVICGAVFLNIFIFRAGRFYRALKRTG